MLDLSIKREAERYAAEYTAEAEALLKELGRIPAPSRQEDRRAQFILQWLKKQGAEKAYIDEMKNVICEIGTDEHDKLIVWAAHTDIVFADLEELPMKEDGRILRAPGIGDDTANLVNLLMGAKYLLENRTRLDTGFVIAANTCEEGLGNSDGAKQIAKTFGERMEGFYSFDGYLSQCTYIAVGSHRYRITVKTPGGHSWVNFGNKSAVLALANIITRLCAIPLPEDGPEDKTTFNAGVISGGTTVNSIAGEAVLLYEFRSTSQKSLAYMEARMNEVLESCREEDVEISVELLGLRPGNGDLDKEALAAWTANSTDVIRTWYDGEMDYAGYSTDSNIPLSRGIVANTIGTITGDRAHTRDEWMNLDSIPDGMKIVLSLMLQHEVRG